MLGGAGSELSLRPLSWSSRSLNAHSVSCATYCLGRGVAVDYKQARAWFEKAAAQDYPNAFSSLGTMYYRGDGVTPSWRRARELWERAIELGCSQAVKDMQNLTESIPQVSYTSRRFHHLPYRQS